MDFLRSVLSKNVHHGLAVKLIHRDCDNGMPRGEARIVGRVLLHLVRLFAEQPTPKASALIFRLTCPVFLVGRFVLGIALDVSGRYLGVFEIADGCCCDRGRVEGSDNHFRHGIPLVLFWQNAEIRKRGPKQQGSVWWRAQNVFCLPVTWYPESLKRRKR